MVHVFPYLPSVYPQSVVFPGVSSDDEDGLCRERSYKAGVCRGGSQKKGRFGKVDKISLVQIWLYLCRTCYSAFRVCYKTSRYDNCKKTLQAQLAKNEMSIGEVPPESVSLNGLHSRLQEIQVPHQSELGMLNHEPELSVVMLGRSPLPVSEAGDRGSLVGICKPVFPARWEL